MMDTYFSCTYNPIGNLQGPIDMSCVFLCARGTGREKEYRRLCWHLEDLLAMSVVKLKSITIT